MLRRLGFSDFVSTATAATMLLLPVVPCILCIDSPAALSSTIFAAAIAAAGSNHTTAATATRIAVVIVSTVIVVGCATLTLMLLPPPLLCRLSLGSLALQLIVKTVVSKDVNVNVIVINLGDGLPKQPTRLLHVLDLDGALQIHARTRFTQSDHRFELSDCDAI